MFEKEPYVTLGTSGPVVTDWLPELIKAHAPLTPVPCVPELVAPQCRGLTQLWEATERVMGAQLEHAPFWATPWPGGIALARWVFDHPGRFQGRNILDMGSGSGVSGLAAAQVGGRVVLNDVDPLALCVARWTARANGLRTNFLPGDLSDQELESHEIIFVGDGFYERDRAARLIRRLEACVNRGRTVITADAGRNIVDLPGKCVLQIEVPVSQDIEGQDTRIASVHLLEP